VRQIASFYGEPPSTEENCQPFGLKGEDFISFDSARRLLNPAARKRNRSLKKNSKKEASQKCEKPKPPLNQTYLERNRLEDPN